MMMTFSRLHWEEYTYVDRVETTQVITLFTYGEPFARPAESLYPMIYINIEAGRVITQ